MEKFEDHSLSKHKEAFDLVAGNLILLAVGIVVLLPFQGNLLASFVIEAIGIFIGIFCNYSG